ncbi:SagB family peptide dehydrogenase [Streptomyces sp. KM273126]|uniref:SagB/ThcOx family dehydrogenase n=1 Tax=Streptomyces sp. KM273126 TaxID=2545247 RepID=UPI00103C5205|nr:SagB family peptide dehydrogenase [Streptomyces sp. KM273126]MBA2806236.1 SagB family peptide dehydrogenase [Streptomyces sp. KM273126]
MSVVSPFSTAVTAQTERRCVSFWSLREDVLVDTSGPSGCVVLSGRWGEVRLRGAGPSVRETLRRMSLGPISLANAVAGLTADDSMHPPSGGPETEILAVLHRLQHLVVRSLSMEESDRLLMSVVPIARSARYRPVAADRCHPVRLSRFAFLRSEGQGFVLESPASLYRVVVHGPEVSWLIGMLGRPVTIDQMAASVPLSVPVISGIVAHLLATGMVVPAERPHTGEGTQGDAPAGGGAVPHFAEDQDPALLSWSAVDLFFHSRSTLGRHDADFGATYPLAQRTAPAPAVKPLPDGPRLPLARPSLTEVAASDPPLTTVLEERRTVRSFGPDRLTAAVLGEFLYRALRIRSLYESPDDSGHTESFSDRPYPSGANAYELEFYLTVRDCADVPPGTYYYAPLEHCLVRLGDGETDPTLPERLAEAQVTAGLTEPPAVVITITSRIHRLAWKYSGLPYALTLKHVGAVIQNLYLIGTAMGLASCALGSGDIELAARTTGTDWRIEPSVGGFILGTPPEPSSTSPSSPTVSS